MAKVDREFSDFISTVLDKTDITRLISRYVKLERKGNTYWACCPFHHETQPSFAVNEAKQFFHCFGCKESGNAISFVMKAENVEFIDALKMLADQAGLEMPERRGYSQGPDKKAREALYALMRDAARHYHDNLSDPRAKVFNDYLAERKIPQSMVTRFGLGASLDFNEMISFLRSKGYTYEQMHAAGIAETKDGRQYDVFGKRLMFPIIDNMGHVVAFGGRTLEKDVHFAKYRNSTQTDIFDKSRVIYGVNLLKKRKAAAKIDYVIMTEGYMDVIALHKAGFDTAVASMGTALTARQAKQLKLYSDLVYICYDGDTAGQKGMLRGLDILRENGLTVKVVRLPDGLDPDDLIKRDGPEVYKKCLEQAIPLTAYKIEVLSAKYDISDPDQKAKFAIEAANVVKALDNPVEQEQYFDYISAKTGFSVEVLARQASIVAAADGQKQRDYDAPQVAEQASYGPDIKYYLYCLASGCEFVKFDRDLSDAMPDARAKAVYELAKTRGVESVRREYFSEDASAEDRAYFNELLDYAEMEGDGAAKFSEIENKLYAYVLENTSKKLSKLYAETKDKTYLFQQQQISTELAKLRNIR